MVQHVDTATKTARNGFVSKKLSVVAHHGFGLVRNAGTEAKALSESTRGKQGDSSKQSEFFSSFSPFFVKI